MKKLYPEWLRTGECSKCAHKSKCKNICEPCEGKANAHIKKAILMDLERRNALC